MKLNEITRQWHEISYTRFVKSVSSEQVNFDVEHDDGLVTIFAGNKKVGEFKYEGDDLKDDTRGEY